MKSSNQVVRNYTIVISNPKSANPSAEQMIKITGTWNEAIQLLNHTRVEQPECYVGLRCRC